MIVISYRIVVVIFIFLTKITTINGDDKTDKFKNNLDDIAGIPRLPSLTADGITVSGISSGGYFAVQMHVSHSSIINGSAIFAAGPFYCAEGTLLYAETKCLNGTYGGPETESLVALTLTDETLGYVDKVKNLSDDMIYIFSGKLDTVVFQKVVKQLENYYSNFINKKQIITEYDFPAEHCMPTLNYGEKCTELSSPYIGNCKLDGAGEAFQTLFKNLNSPVEMISSNLHSFDQSSYIPTPLSSIGKLGYIYIPTSCQSNDSVVCKLHISFHGCDQTLQTIGNQYAAHSGYNEWAESNNIVVLYPYIEVSYDVPYNPKGCWDWWGYTGPLYGVKLGVQVQFVRNLIFALTGK